MFAYDAEKPDDILIPLLMIVTNLIRYLTDYYEVFLKIFQKYQLTRKWKYQ